MIVVFSIGGFGNEPPRTMQKAYLSVAQAAAGVNKWAKQNWYPVELLHAAPHTLGEVTEYARYLRDPEGHLREGLAQVQAQFDAMA